MGFQNLMGTGGTLEEAEQDLEDRIEVAKGMGLVVLETQSYSIAATHYACARVCTSSLKSAIDKDQRLWYTLGDLVKSSGQAEGGTDGEHDH